MSRRLLVTLMVGGCGAAPPAHSISPTYAVAHIDIDANALASELRNNVDALAKHYVRGSFDLDHEPDASRELSADDALAAARSSARC
jgi:hypothetical protein